MFTSEDVVRFAAHLHTAAVVTDGGIKYRELVLRVAMQDIAARPLIDHVGEPVVVGILVAPESVVAVEANGHRPSG